MTYTETRWKLDALIGPEAADLDKARRTYERRVKKVEGWRAALKPSMAAGDFQALLKDLEALQEAGARLEAYASLRFSADTQDQAALALLSQVQEMRARADNRVLFVSLWWKSLNDRQAERLLRGAGDLRYWLESIRRFKPHTLSEPEEKVINLKDVNGSEALETIYEQITNKFEFTLEVDGETKRLTRGELSAYVQHPDPALREAAYRELFRVYGEDAPVLAQIYSHRVRDWFTEQVELRKHKSPISVRNLANDLPDAVVETLLRVIGENAGVFQRYFRLKARWLGLDRLRRYDLYAPLTPADKAYDYDTAVGMVLDSFTEFSPQVGALARQVFDDGHVDAQVRHGKRSGAFCAGVLPGVSPWVLLNYTRRARDVATIAHEMGHAIHALLAADHSVLTFHSALPMAETASVFSEQLLTDRLLKQESDPAVRRDLLARTIDDAYATVGRQGYFAMWEKQVHDLVRQGKTADEIAVAYLDGLKAQFGDSVELSEDFRWEWVAVPHFYFAPFYVYAYAFGQLLVLALYQMYKREGEAFKPKYLRILSYGGSRSPDEILREAGINMRSAKFWQGGYDAITAMIDELEALEAPQPA